MPRSRSRSAVPPRPSETSWLLAPPQTTLRPQGLHGDVVEGAPHRVGAEHVELGAHEVLDVLDRGDRRVAEQEGAHGIRVDVGHDDLGAVLEEVLGEPAADLPHPGDADAATGQRGLAPHVLRRRPHALEHAVCREHRRVARATALRRASGRPAGRLADDVHVGDVGADVAGRDVAPAEGLDEPAVGPQQLGRLVAVRVADDDGLAAAVVEPGDGVLARHGAREAQHVGDGVVGRGVGVEPCAAEPRTQRRRVEGDDRTQPRVGVGAERDLLVAGEVDEVGGHDLTLDPGGRGCRGACGGM